jgi:hypothetical protein
VEPFKEMKTQVMIYSSANPQMCSLCACDIRSVLALNVLNKIIDKGREPFKEFKRQLMINSSANPQACS